jgi:SH3-like domain-containing protein
MQMVKKPTWRLFSTVLLGLPLATTGAWAAAPADDEPLADEASAATIHKEATSAADDAAEKAKELARYGVFPRYASLKKSEVNVRSGPGNQYPILWVYQRAGYPVLLLARYDNYLKIRDVEGEEGWVYVGLVAKQRTALVQGKAPVPLYRKADAASPMVARLAPGVVVTLEDCEHPTLCEIRTETVKGWVAKASLSMLELPRDE